jgi:hypothetical protein
MHCASESAVTVSAVSKNVKQMRRRAGAKRDFETEQSGVFAPPGLFLAHFLTAESGFSGSKRRETGPCLAFAFW